MTKREQIVRVKLWTAALRSGYYKQAIGRLRHPTENAWSCLGVACLVYQLETGDESWADGMARTSLPPQVFKWYGFDDGDPRITLPGWSYSLPLSYLNDHGKSFSELAEIIEFYIYNVKGDDENAN